MSQIAGLETPALLAHCTEIELNWIKASRIACSVGIAWPLITDLPGNHACRNTYNNG